LPLEIAGAPTGYQYGAFIELLVAVSQGRHQLSPALENFAKNLKLNVLLEVLVSPTCPYSPHVVRLAQHFALSNPGRVYARSVDVTQVALSERSVSVVPYLTVQVQGQIRHRHQGMLTAGELAGFIDAGEREARAYARGIGNH
jgi:alkyl hydroperoxide reductase subunit AhpF